MLHNLFPNRKQLNVFRSKINGQYLKVRTRQDEKKEGRTKSLKKQLRNSTNLFLFSKFILDSFWISICGRYLPVSLGHKMELPVKIRKTDSKTLIRTYIPHPFIFFIFLKVLHFYTDILDDLCYTRNTNRVTKLKIYVRRAIVTNIHLKNDIVILSNDIKYLLHFSEN